MSTTREIHFPFDATLLKGGESIWLRIQMDQPEASPVLETPVSRQEVSPRYCIWRCEREWGPYTLKDLRMFWSMGTLEETDFVRDESVGDWQSLAGLVSSLPGPARIGCEHPVRLHVRTENLDEEAPEYFDPYFNGNFWYGASAAVCAILALVLSLPFISSLVPAACFLALAFVLAAKGCWINQSWLGMAVPVLALWLLAMIQLDQIHWMPFKEKARVAAPSVAPVPEKSALSLMMFMSPMRPAQPDRTDRPMVVEAPRVPDSPVVWVEYSGNP